jgi:hypothetical protein
MEYEVKSKYKHTKLLYCSRLCYAKAQRAAPKKGYRVGGGYMYLYLPDHPKASKQGYVAEHRIIGEKIVGRYLREDEIVHHINGIKQDNRIENLIVCSNSEHAKLHAGELIKRNKERGTSGAYARNVVANI